MCKSGSQPCEGRGILQGRYLTASPPRSWTALRRCGRQLQAPGSTWKEAGGSGRDEPSGKCKELTVRAV